MFIAGSPGFQPAGHRGKAARVKPVRSLQEPGDLLAAQLARHPPDPSRGDFTRKSGRKAAVLVPVAALTLVAPAAIQAAQDWGSTQEDRTAAHSSRLFGFPRPLASSAVGDIDATSLPAARQVKLAQGLQAEKVASVAEDGDMMAFWPTDNNPGTPSSASRTTGRRMAATRACSGRTAYLNIQHNDVSTADPMLRITGWTKP